jgi:POT family proton-dependent oligopeptide transporter
MIKNMCNTRQKLMALLFKKYPQGFGGLFTTQAFFNFSFYGLKSIFVLYIIAQLSVTEQEAIGLFATLMALSYATSLVGGWIADQGLGIKNTIIIGGMLQSLGIACLMFPSQELCFLALALISLGSGFYKPNLSSSVGMLFENPQDVRKDKAYSTFYIAMNLGCFVAPLLCGFVSKTYGGYYSSLLLIIVTLIGGVYLFYQEVDFKQQREISSKMSYLTRPAFLGGLIFILLGLLYFLFKYHGLFSHLMSVIAIGSLVYLGKIAYESTPQERKNITQIVMYIVLFALFCALFEQAGSSLMLFFEKVVDRTLFGIEIPAATLLSLGPVFVFFLSPLLAWYWEKVLEKKRSMDGLIKIAVGFLLTALSFVILALACIQTKAMVPLFWVVVAILIQTLGELWIVPIGFSNISKLAPPRFRSVMMSFWLMAIAYGHYVGGFIAQFSLSESSTGETSLDHYQSFFWNLALMPCLLGILVLFYYYGLRSKNTFQAGAKPQTLT